MAIFHALIFSAILGLTNVSVGLYSERWLIGDERAEVTAGRLVAIMWLITGIMTPIFGLVIDFIGFRAIIVKTTFLNI
jgi:hypothetical protein